MRRLRLTLLLLMLLMLLTACAPSGNSMEALSVTAAPQEDEIPRADGDDAAPTDTSALIWYRYGDEPMLAAERRTVSRLPNEPYETALLRLLLEGPSLNAPALRGLFPAGTRVISTSRQGEMLFVTLSYQLMNGYSDEPSNWRSDTAWAQEVPLRRRLAMQTIAATVTENTTAQQVVILLEQRGETTDSMRLRQKYYTLNAADDALADPLRRDESLLLTASGTMRTILTCIQQRHHQRHQAKLAFFHGVPSTIAVSWLMLMHHSPPVFIRWTLRPVNFCDTPSANLVPLTVKTARVPEALPPEKSNAVSAGYSVHLDANTSYSMRALPVSGSLSAR